MEAKKIRQFNCPDGVWKTLLFLSGTKFLVLCFFLAMILVVMGTIAQTGMGNLAVQEFFFNSFLIYVKGPFGVSLPVFPGGLGVGLLWSLSIIAALLLGMARKQLSLGYLATHLGILFLLFGQFYSQIFSQDLRIFLSEGESSNYAISLHELELVLVRMAPQDNQEAVSFPYSKLYRGKKLQHESLPFMIKVKSLYPNSELLKADPGSQDEIATQGLGKGVFVRELPVFGLDENNISSALIDIMDGEKSIGTWLVSSEIKEPQAFQFRDKEYGVLLSPRREKLPFSLKLENFSHDVYPGTDIPKNFSSLVHLSHPEQNENRSVLIYMNHPLRYGGYAFYQASYGKDNKISILQVVKNPVWLAPYISCTLIVFGLAIQFCGRLWCYLRGADGRMEFC